MGFSFKKLGGFLGALNPVGLIGNIGAGILGGGLDYMAAESDRRSQEAINAQNLQYSRESDASQMALAERNMALQKEFAQHGVRWRMEDAIAAGLHPLAALGLMPIGSSPVSVMSNPPNLQSGGSSRGNLYRSLSAMGQNVSRAVMATAQADERALVQANLNKVLVETDYMKAMAQDAWNRVNAPQNPPLPDPNSGMTGGDVRVLPGMYQFMRTPNGWTTQWSDEYARAMQARPLSMLGHDLWDIMSDAARSSGYVARHMGSKLNPMRFMNPRKWYQRR